MVGAHDTTEPRRKVVVSCQCLDVESMIYNAVRPSERTNTIFFCRSGAQMLLGAQSLSIEESEAERADIHPSRT